MLYFETLMLAFLWQNLYHLKCAVRYETCLPARVPPLDACCCEAPESSLIAKPCAASGQSTKTLYATVWLQVIVASMVRAPVVENGRPLHQISSLIV